MFALTAVAAPAEVTDDGGKGPQSCKQWWWADTAKTVSSCLRTNRRFRKRAHLWTCLMCFLLAASDRGMFTLQGFLLSLTIGGSLLAKCSKPLLHSFVVHSLNIKLVQYKLNNLSFLLSWAILWFLFMSEHPLWVLLYYSSIVHPGVYLSIGADATQPVSVTMSVLVHYLKCELIFKFSSLLRAENNKMLRTRMKVISSMCENLPQFR